MNLTATIELCPIRFTGKHLNNRQRNELAPVLAAAERVGCTELFVDAQYQYWSGHVVVEDVCIRFEPAMSGHWKQEETVQQFAKRMFKWLDKLTP